MSTRVFGPLALGLALLVLAACQGKPAPTIGPASAATALPAACVDCPPATQGAALTQANINARALQAQQTATADIQNAQALATYKAGTATQAAALVAAQIDTIALQAQAAATADILRAHALATLNAAGSTQAAAQTQDRLNSNALEADAAGTAGVLQAEALATFNSASSTQGSALTQVALGLRLTAQVGTQAWMDLRVAGTATTLAHGMIVQTESAAGTAGQNGQQNQNPFVQMFQCGLALFILSMGVVGLWLLWRWLTTHPGRGVRALPRSPPITAVLPVAPGTSRDAPQAPAAETKARLK
jgi:hypothetical protein